MDQTEQPTFDIPDRSPHTFHIPVMGTGFTIDTPLKVTLRKTIEPICDAVAG